MYIAICLKSIAWKKNPERSKWAGPLGALASKNPHRLRVQPLRRRAQPMWALERGNELDDDEVESKVRSITSLRQADTCNVKCPVEPYGPNNPVPGVSTLNSLFVLL